MEDFVMFKGRHEIEFATDEKDRVTVIVGENGTGKTTIVDAIKGALGIKRTIPRYLEMNEGQRIDPEALDWISKNAKANVEIEGDKIRNRADDELCHFLDGELLHVGFPELKEDKIVGTDVNVNDSFIDEMNELFVKSGSYKQHLHFARDKNSIFYVNDVGQKYWPSAFHKIIQGMIFWIVFRRRISPKSFIIADSIFGRLKTHSRISFFEMLKETDAQIVLLVTDNEYRGIAGDGSNDDPYKSLREIIIEQMNVKEYNLVRTEEGTKIKLIH